MSMDICIISKDLEKLIELHRYYGDQTRAGPVVSLEKDAGYLVDGAYLHQGKLVFEALQKPIRVMVLLLTLNYAISAGWKQAMKLATRANLNVRQVITGRINTPRRR